MKNNSFLFLVLTFLFAPSCKKDNLTLQEIITKQEVWNATKFIVQGENTMAPDNSPILDAPISFVQLKFIDENNLTLELELKYDTYLDKSGLLPMTYNLDEQKGTIEINDENSWTMAASFSGLHKINLTNNILTIDGLLGDTMSFKLILK